MDHLDKLTEILNSQGSIMAIRMNNERDGYIHAVNFRQAGDKHITVADHDGYHWLIKLYLAGVLVFEYKTASPVEVVRYILLEA